MKKILGLISLLCVILFFSNCMPAYVQVEPAYIEAPRPLQPSSTHIWIGGNWMWSNRSHGYIQQDGYWAAPRRGRTYQQGHWRKGDRGSRWERGRWN